jgi:hypothetical protein
VVEQLAAMLSGTTALHYRSFSSVADLLSRPRGVLSLLSFRVSF